MENAKKKAKNVIVTTTAGEYDLTPLNLFKNGRVLFAENS